MDAPPAAFGEKRRKDLHKGHKKSKSTAEDLFALAMDLQELDEGDGSDIRQVASLGDSPKSDEMAINAADFLAKHGQALVKRHRLDSTADETKGEGKGTAAEGNAATAKKEKTDNVKGETPVGESKKTDISVPDLEAGDNESGEDTDDSDNTDQFRQHRNSASRFKRANKRIIANYKDFEDWMKYKMGYKEFFKVTMLYFVLPLIGVAAILYYIFENPLVLEEETSCDTPEECTESLRNEANEAINLLEAQLVSNSTGTDGPRVTYDSIRELLITNEASYSWWLLFVARQLITFNLAKFTEAILIEYLALRSKLCVWLLGPFVTLFLVQSKGWPVVCFLWSLFDFFLLYGHGEFAAHW